MNITMARKIPPLIVESIEDGSNMFYTSLIEYKKQKYLTIVNDITEDEILAYVLDLAKVEQVDLNWLVHVANKWYYTNSEKHPISFEFAKMGAQRTTAPLLRSFNVDNVTRVVGKVFCYSDARSKIKRRRVLTVPENISIKLKKTA